MDSLTCSKCKRVLTLEEFRPIKGGLRYTCYSCRKAYLLNYYNTHKEVYAKRAYHEHRRRRMVIINGYGGKCVCCGESNPFFLALDHVEGGGGKERREHSPTTTSNAHLYPKIIADGFPPKYRILCHNCNLARGFYGFCPHERPDEKYTE